MDVFLTVRLLGFAVILVGLFIGRFWMRLSWSHTAIACCLAFPVPLFTVSPGRAGFIYAQDILALVMFAGLTFGRFRPKGSSASMPALYLWLAGLILVVLPGLSTALGYVMFPDASREIKYVALDLARGVGFLLVFRCMASVMQSERNPSRFLALQGIVFGGICFLGVMQYAFNLQLDMWGAMRGDVTAYEDAGYGGGFMGLYRGAVGAWGIGMIPVITLVFAGRRLGGLIAASLTALIFAVMFAVGTRQGVLIGSFGLLLAIGLTVSRLPGQKIAGFMKSLGLVMAMLLIGGIATLVLVPDKLARYAGERFEGLTEFDTAIRLVKTRDPRYGYVTDYVLENPAILFSGVGYGTEQAQYRPIRAVYIDSEFFLIWQIGGLLLLVPYLLFLVLLLRRLRGYKRIHLPDSRAYVAAAFAALAAGILMLYGHFFLLTPYAHNAAPAYWYWGLFGGGLGILLNTGHIEAEFYLNSITDSLDSVPTQNN
jgi:hypothetical protein